MKTTQQSAPNSTDQIQKTSALDQLEHARLAFFELMDRLDEKSARKKSVESKRTLMAVAAHIVMSMEMTYPMFVTRAVAGNLQSMPGYFATPFGHWISYMLSEQRAKKETLASLRTGYEAAHAKFAGQLGALKAADWSAVSTLPKPRNQVMTVAEFIAVEIPGHLDLHRQEVARTIARHSH